MRLFNISRVAAFYMADFRPTAGVSSAEIEVEQRPGSVSVREDTENLSVDTMSVCEASCISAAVFCFAFVTPIHKILPNCFLFNCLTVCSTFPPFSMHFPQQNQMCQRWSHNIKMFLIHQQHFDWQPFCSCVPVLTSQSTTLFRAYEVGSLSVVPLC